MRIYKFEGLANQLHAIGEREQFKMYIRAENRDDAIERLYSKWEHITIEHEFSIDGIDWWRANSDINGNPRWVCHFTQLIQDYYSPNYKEHFDIDDKYKIALNRAKKFGGRRFHNKQYGGGIVFCTYSITSIEDCILDVIDSESNIEEK
jgi:hypothetical protein